MSDADYDRALAYERRVATLEARIAELAEWRRLYEGVALALGYAEQPEGQGGVRVASHQTVMNAIHDLQRDSSRLRDEADAAGSVAKEAADWVRRLAEFAPLLHVADRRDGEAEARAWLAAWDSSGAAIAAKRAAEFEAARARIAELERERGEAVLDGHLVFNSLNALVGEESSKRAAARADLDEAMRLLRACLDGWIRGDDMITPMHAAHAYLARHPTPDKEPRR